MKQNALIRLTDTDHNSLSVDGFVFFVMRVENYSNIKTFLKIQITKPFIKTQSATINQYR